MIDKKHIQHHIARVAYKVWYGAKLNFWTYDIVIKLPPYVSFFSLVIGILGLSYPEMGEGLVKFMSVSILIMGIISFYVERFDADKHKSMGIKNINQRNELHTLYEEMNSTESRDRWGQIEERVKEIEKDYSDTAIPRQITFAHWCAHFKFFSSEHKWIDEQLNFKWHNKIPPSVKILVAMIGISLALLLLLIYTCPTFNVWMSELLSVCECNK